MIYDNVVLFIPVSSIIIHYDALPPHLQASDRHLMAFTWNHHLS